MRQLIKEDGIEVCAHNEGDDYIRTVVYAPNVYMTAITRPDSGRYSVQMSAHRVDSDRISIAEGVAGDQTYVDILVSTDNVAGDRTWATFTLFGITADELRTVLSRHVVRSNVQTTILAGSEA